MLYTVIAVLAFAVMVALLEAVHGTDDVPDCLPGDAPRALPDPSPRDVHALTGTLGKAPVPSWG